MAYDVSNRSRLIQLCKERVDADGIADVRQVSRDYQNELGGEVDWYEAVRVANILCKEDNKYTHDYLDQYTPRIKHNLNYALEESVKTTNANTTLSNTRSISIGNKANLLAGVSGAFILASVLVSVYQIFNAERLSPQLQQIDTTLQNQSRELDSLKQTQRSVNYRLQTILDSLSKKP